MVGGGTDGEEGGPGRRAERGGCDAVREERAVRLEPRFRSGKNIHRPGQPLVVHDEDEDVRPSAGSRAHRPGRLDEGAEGYACMLLATVGEPARIAQFGRALPW